MDQIKENKTYILGMLFAALIGATATAFGPNRSDIHIVIQILGTAIMVILFGFIIGGIILGVSWLFTKKFSFTRLIRTTTIVCIVWTVAAILSALMSVR